MSDMMKNSAGTSKEEPKSYEFGPEARDACWTSFVSSLNRLLEKTDYSIQHAICDSSNHDSEFEDADKCKGDIINLTDTDTSTDTASSDVTYNSENGFGMMAISKEVLVLPKALYPIHQPIGPEELCNFPPKLFLVKQPAEKVFAEQPPPVTNGHASDQDECVPVVDYTPPMLSIRKSDFTNNNVNKNDSKWTNVKATPKPEREPDLPGADQVADSVGLFDVKEDVFMDCLPMLSSSSEFRCMKRSSEWQTLLLSECSQFVRSSTLENLSLANLLSDIECVPMVEPDHAPFLLAEEERLACGNGNYVLDSDESYVLEQHPIMENLYMEIDRTIEWYSKVFLAIVLFVLINFLL